MDFVERFKNRRVLTPVLDVPFHGFTFKIARFSEAERQNVRLKARARITEGGDNPDESTPAEQSTAYCLVLPEFLKRHVKGWTAPEGADIPFNAGNLAMLFDELSEVERLELSVAYITAEADDEEKKIPKPVESGENSSKSESGTNSTSQN